jgi:hypothetical protein
VRQCRAPFDQARNAVGIAARSSQLATVESWPECERADSRVLVTGLVIPAWRVSTHHVFLAAGAVGDDGPLGTLTVAAFAEICLRQA